MKKLMKKQLMFILTAAVFVFQNSCTPEPSTDLTQTSFIPKPVSVEATGEKFVISENTTIYYQEDDEGLEQTARYLAEKIKRITELTLQVSPAEELPRKGIYLSLNDTIDELENEGYNLNIGREIISIQAYAPAGCFYAIQTLQQTMPVKGNVMEPVEIPTGIVIDFPEHDYRGAMLDVARHFFSVEDVKRFINFLAAYKMNILHLHLSDDQGWRIEIKSWPKLTEIGGSTEVGGGEGGFYTQEEYADIIQYARNRHITIVPEIDMPGHTNAALTSYPKLNCDGKATEMYTGTEVGFSTLCTRKEITYEFVNDVIREISQLTPGPYFHIGGDETHVTEQEDYIYFINRVQEIVVSHGKKVVGWDEIAHAELVDSAVVQFWDNVENTLMAVEQGAKVIMSPASRAYLDMKYDSTTHLGLNWAGYVEVDTAYSWNPVTLVPGITKENILGLEAPLWTETITNMNEIEYMVFPRLPGFAEIGWTAPEARSWEEYKTRLAAHGSRFDAMDINFYRSDLVPWKEQPSGD